MSFMDVFVHEKTNVIGHNEPITDEAVAMERDRWSSERQAFLGRWGGPSWTGALVVNSYVEDLAMANYSAANPDNPFPSYITTTGYAVPSWSLLTDPYSVAKESFYPYVVDRVEKTSGINWAGTIATTIVAAIATFGASLVGAPEMAAGESAAEMLMFETGGMLTAEEAAALSVLPEAGAAGLPIGDLSMYDFGVQMPEASGATLPGSGVLDAVTPYVKLLAPLASLARSSGPGVTGPGVTVGQNIDNSNTVTQILIPITGINVEAPKESANPYSTYWITTPPGNPIPETADTYIAGVSDLVGIAAAPGESSISKYFLLGGLALLILSGRN